jgi:hypothetical protein
MDTLGSASHAESRLMAAAKQNSNFLFLAVANFLYFRNNSLSRCFQRVKKDRSSKDIFLVTKIGAHVMAKTLWNCFFLLSSRTNRVITLTSWDLALYIIYNMLWLSMHTYINTQNVKDIHRNPSE